MHRFILSLPVLVALIARGRDVTESDVKMAGVGLDPDEIGPAPEPYGGFIEYDWVNFAGGGLSLAALGLVSYDEAGPGLVGFKPPYAAVYGLAFIFDEAVPAPDVHHGAIGVGPEVEDACWTNYEPFSFLLASTAEVGDNLTFSAEGDSSYFSLGRFPEIYPPDPQDVFVYYIGVESWVAQAVERYTGLGETEVVRPANFAHGSEVAFSFPGGIPPVNAPVSSIPLPSDSVGPQPLTLPTMTSDLRLTWDGKVWDGRGGLVTDSGDEDWTSCVNFLGEATPLSEFAEGRCQEEFPVPETGQIYFPGQIYTGPWDTDDGSVDFKWTPGAEGEKVTLNIRFLGPVDRTSESFLTGRVPIDATNEIESFWSEDVSDGLVDPSQDDDIPPQGYRPTMACEPEDDIDWVFNPTYEDAEGDLIVPLRGDPSYNLVEVSCTLADDGEFSLTMDHLDGAIEYATRKGAEGAMFYFGRSTELDAEVPAVRDQAGFKREISPILIRAQSVDIGRFWIDGTLSDQAN